MKQIIGLHGARGVGKDTIADILVEDYGFQKIAFADRLYDEVNRHWMTPIELLRDRERKNTPDSRMAVIWCESNEFLKWYTQTAECSAEIDRGERWIDKPRSPRWCLQRWSDFQKARCNNPLVYQHAVERAIAEMSGDKVVISDVRYDHEARYVLQSSDTGLVVEVTKPGVSNPQGEHVSDDRLADSLISKKLRNCGDMIELYHRVDELMRDIEVSLVK